MHTRPAWLQDTFLHRILLNVCHVQSKIRRIPNSMIAETTLPDGKFPLTGFTNSPSRPTLYELDRPLKSHIRTRGQEQMKMVGH